MSLSSKPNWGRGMDKIEEARSGGKNDVIRQLFHSLFPGRKSFSTVAFLREGSKLRGALSDSPPFRSNGREDGSQKSFEIDILSPFPTCHLMPLSKTFLPCRIPFQAQEQEEGGLDSRCRDP